MSKMPRSRVRGTKGFWNDECAAMSAQLPLPGQANSMRAQDGATQLTLPNGWRIRQLGGRRGGRAPAASEPFARSPQGRPERERRGRLLSRILKARHGDLLKSPERCAEVLKGASIGPDELSKKKEEAVQ